MTSLLEKAEGDVPVLLDDFGEPAVYQPDTANEKLIIAVVSDVVSEEDGGVIRSRLRLRVAATGDAGLADPKPQEVINLRGRTMTILERETDNPIYGLWPLLCSVGGALPD